ncbi:ferric reductase-like transmembrane domain-containing protein [Pseudomonas sp. Q1-7]|uniref:ferric reductase-like transmembrane domain-containing protein n=1 Tax=Pseudomonas sp. Q1-7 TaxID=3020843 RepID=UPI002301882C|nr:ferric reductase-like transmembrane domain-containing protein [Pseudomonas sp. Q1-7]
MLVLISRLGLLATLPFSLILLADPMPGLAPVWDFANAAGFLCGLLLMLLFVYSGRPLARPHYDGKFFMNLHRDLSYVALVLLLLHVGVLVVSEPQVLDYLLPQAAWPMLSGTVSALLLLALVPISLPGVRQRIWRHHVRFRRWHQALSSLMLALLAIHVIAAGFYTAGLWKALLWGGLTCVALVWPLLPRRPLERTASHRRRNTAGYASWLCAGMLVAALGLAGGFALVANSDLPL